MRANERDVDVCYARDVVPRERDGGQQQQQQQQQKQKRTAVVLIGQIREGAHAHQEGGRGEGWGPLIL